MQIFIEEIWWISRWEHLKLSRDYTKKKNKLNLISMYIYFEN